MILAPQLVTARAIQLTPVYTGGAVMADGAVIPQDRTAVPVEWDELRVQLEKLTEMLQPTEPGGVSTLGALINTGADNLRGQGPTIRDTVIKMSQAFSVLGDHSNDLFSSVKNLSTLVSALQSSSDLMAQLNRNLASVSALLADDPHEVGRALDDLNTAVGDVQAFVADNRETLGTTFDKLTSVSQALVDSIDDVKQFLHLAPGTLQGLSNIYQPAQAALSTAPVVNNFANPIEFLCGAVQAASRLGSRAGVEAMRSVPGTDHQEPPDQLSTARTEPASSAPRPGPTRSRTARTGCDRITCRHNRPHRQKGHRLPRRRHRPRRRPTQLPACRASWCRRGPDHDTCSVAPRHPGRAGVGGGDGAIRLCLARFELADAARDRG